MANKLDFLFHVQIISVTSLNECYIWFTVTQNMPKARTKTTSAVLSVSDQWLHPHHYKDPAGNVLSETTRPSILNVTLVNDFFSFSNIHKITE